MFGRAGVAAPPAEMDYQGRITIDGRPYHGAGYVKFALSPQGGATNYWASDGTACGEPVAAVALTVITGRFSATLGAAPMQAIDPAVLGADEPLYLRVWFSSDAVSFMELLPPQKLASTPFALNALTLNGQPGAFYLDASRLAAGTIAPERLPESVTRLGPTIESGEIAAGSFSNTFWTVGGNRGAGGYLGTSGAEPLDIRVNGECAIYVQVGGRVGVGTVSPEAGFHVTGTGRFDEGIPFVAPLGDLTMGVYTNRP